MRQSITFTVLKFYHAFVLVGLLSIMGGNAVRAQSQSAAAGQIGTLSLPQLPQGGGAAAIVQAIRLGVKYSRAARRELVQGQNVVSFVVSPTGEVCLIKIEHSLRPDLDSAVVEAVRRLPRLQPARQLGRPVACSMQAPVSFVIDNPPPLPKQPLPALDSTQVVTAVTRMASYAGQLTGYQQLAADWVREYLRANQNTGCTMPKIGMSVLVTVGPSGGLYGVRINKNDQAQQEAMKARFPDQVVQLNSTEQDEFRETCLSQLAAAAQRLPRLTPAYLNDRPVATRLILNLFNPNWKY